MVRLAWAMERPDYLVKRYCGSFCKGMFEKFSIESHRLNKVDQAPWCGWASSNQVWAEHSPPGQRELILGAEILGVFLLRPDSKGPLSLAGPESDSLHTGTLVVQQAFLGCLGLQIWVVIGAINVLGSLVNCMSGLINLLSYSISHWVACFAFNSPVQTRWLWTTRASPLSHSLVWTGNQCYHSKL